MALSTIQLGYWLSLGLVAAGMLFLAWWGWRTVRRYTGQGFSGRVSLSALFVRMLPGLLGFVALSVPAFYFNHLNNQSVYCVEVIKVNKLTAPTEAFNERCSAFVFEELFALSQKP